MHHVRFHKRTTVDEFLPALYPHSHIVEMGLIGGGNIIVCVFSIKYNIIFNTLCSKVMMNGEHDGISLRLMKLQVLFLYPCSHIQA